VPISLDFALKQQILRHPVVAVWTCGIPIIFEDDPLKPGTLWASMRPLRLRQRRKFRLFDISGRRLRQKALGYCFADGEDQMVVGQAYCLPWPPPLPLELGGCKHEA
jgi:hypothetical protein